MKKTTHAITSSEVQKPIVLMNRTDGLGERLCAMINAIRLADALDRDFRYFWTSNIWNPVYHKLATAKEKPILGQSITQQEEIFSEFFIENFSLKTHNPKDYRPCPSKPITRAKFDQAEKTQAVKGWVPNQNFMEGEFDKTFMQTVNLSSRDAFNRISFSPAIQNVITAARRVNIKAFDAVHMRSGDMVFGEVRKWGHWSNKVLNPSVAKDLITKLQGQGREVVLFGQDVEGLASLAKERNCLFVGDLIQTIDSTITERSFFEMVLMSRAENIYAGYSGFSRAACMMSNKQVKIPHKLYTAEAYIDITLKDIKAYADKYHPLVNAYSYWQVYDFGGHLLNLPQQYEVITAAAHNDPENLLYPVLQSALLYRMGRDNEAENLIREQIAAQNNTRFLEQLVFKYYSTDFTHLKHFDDFRGGARRPGNDQAKICATEIQKALKQ